MALDLGFLLATTEFVVALDVDAFPISDKWLPTVLGRLQAGAVVAGGADRRGFVHPSFLAMRRLDFVDKRHTFVAQYTGELGVDGWDVGELISVRERGRLGLIPVTSQFGPPPIGSVFGDIVYHNFYGSRHLLEPDPKSAVLDGGATRLQACATFEWAVGHYLGRRVTIPQP